MIGYGTQCLFIFILYTRGQPQIYRSFIIPLEEGKDHRGSTWKLQCAVEFVCKYEPKLFMRSLSIAISTFPSAARSSLVRFVLDCGVSDSPVFPAPFDTFLP